MWDATNSIGEKAMQFPPIPSTLDKLHVSWRSWISCLNNRDCGEWIGSACSWNDLSWRLSPQSNHINNNIICERSNMGPMYRLCLHPTCRACEYMGDAVSAREGDGDKNFCGRTLCHPSGQEGIETYRLPILIEWVALCIYLKHKEEFHMFAFFYPRIEFVINSDEGGGWM